MVKIPCRLIIVFIFCLTIFPFGASTQPPEAKASFLPVQDLAIDETLGKVEERFALPSKSQGEVNDRVVIQIQDVHANYTAQENIAAILEHLNMVCGIEKVALEGAWSATSFPKSRSIPTSREKQLLARSLLDEDLISGPAYAAILASSPLTLLGIEDPVFYEKNRKLYLDHLPKIPAIEAKLETYAKQLEDSKKNTWNYQLFDFGKAVGKFRDTLDLESFFQKLTRTANGLSINYSDLGQIVLIKEIIALEKDIPKDRLKSEIKKLLREYKNSTWTLEELIRGGKLAPEKVGFYPELTKITKLYKLRDQVSLRDLTNQIETLIGRILWVLIKTPAEKSLWDKSERFYLAKRILLLQATPSDLESFEKEKDPLQTELQEAGLADAMNLAVRFYAVVKERDRIFYEKLVNDPVFSGPIAIVTGGFHTAGLSERLRAAGIPYITISPDLGETASNEKLYVKRMTEDAPSKMSTDSITRPGGIPPSPSESQTLSELRNNIEGADEQFVAAYDILLQTKNVRKAVNAFEGALVAVSPAEKISALKAHGKLRRGSPGKTITTSQLRQKEFLKKSREDQLQAVRLWLEEAPETHVRAMLVSSASTVKQMLDRKSVPQLVEQLFQNGDTLVLLDDLPPARMPELFIGRGVERLKADDLDAMVQASPTFQDLAKKHPFAIMKNGYQNNTYVVLPEHPSSLILYRLVTLNSDLYQAAKNPEFLSLLESLVSEIFSQDFVGQSA